MEMKKEYEPPKMTVVELKQESAILVTSGDIYDMNWGDEG